MVSKPKAKTPATAPATNPVSAPLATNPVSATPATNPVSAPPATTPATATTPVVATTPATTFSSLATGAEYESAVNNLIEMGFPRDQVVAAMRAAFNNPDRAAEYLMTVFFC